MKSQKIHEIVIATTNQGKTVEIEHVLSPAGIIVRSLDEFAPLPEARETGATFAQNARQKAQYYSRLLNTCVLADDSGLQVNALDGAPGIYSARFAGVEGSDRDRANNTKLLGLLSGISPEKRIAQFCCSLCLCNPAEILIEVQAFWPGLITDQPRGNNGFGYDPVFLLPNQNKTVAELSKEEKIKISHRGQALQKLLEKLTYLPFGLKL